MHGVITRLMPSKWLLRYYMLRKRLNLRSGSFRAIALTAIDTFPGSEELRNK